MRRAALAAVGIAATTVALAAPATAAPITPIKVALSKSATCTQGDIEITYDGTDVHRQVTTFSEQGGRNLHAYDVHTYAPNHSGLEYILSQTRQPPPPGTIVAVHVLIGETPPTVDTTAEFFIAYRCDPRRNDAGGQNVVVATCVGMVGACPKTAAEVAAPGGGQLTPKFTG